MVTPAFIRDAAKAAFDEGLTFYIPNMRGYGPLNEALSEYQTRLHGQPIPVARTTVTPSGMQALYMALELLVDVGTNVVYVAPQWPNIHNAIHLIGGEPRPFALDFDGDWKLDLDRLFATCDARTRAIFLSTPSNPTGWTASRAEMEALLEFSRRTGIWIISDEVYNRLYFDGGVAPSILQVADDGDRVLSVNSFSKAWAMTGWRVGWLTHPSGIADQLGAMTQYINSGTSGPLQAGAVAAIRQGRAAGRGDQPAHQDRPRPRLRQAGANPRHHPADETARRHVRLLRHGRRKRLAPALRRHSRKGACGAGARLSVRQLGERLRQDVRLSRRRPDRDRARAHARHEELTLREPSGAARKPCGRNPPDQHQRERT